MGIRCADHVTPLYPQKLALTSPTGGCRSVGIVRLRTKATEFFYTKIIVNLQAKWEAVWLLSAVFRYSSATYTNMKQTGAGRDSKIFGQEQTVRCEAPHIRRFHQKQGWCKDWILRTVEKTPVGSFSNRSVPKYRQNAFCFTSRTMDNVEVNQSKQPEGNNLCSPYQITVRINHSNRITHCLSHLIRQAVYNFFFLE